jgi:hypothetical protein
MAVGDVVYLNTYFYLHHDTLVNGAEMSDEKACDMGIIISDDDTF